MAAPHPIKHSNIAHPNPQHLERPNMLPSHKRGQANTPTPFAWIRAKVSGAKR